MKTSVRDEVLERYASQPRWTRFHVRGRLASCPIDPILKELPTEGAIASLGSGHGAFEIAMLLDSRGRRLVGADVDSTKVGVANAAATGLNAEFVTGELFECLRERKLAVDAIVIMDVLYLIPREAQRSLLIEALKALKPGGRILIKEMDVRPRWKWFWNRAQEFLACHILRITRHESGVVGLRSSEEWKSALSDAGFTNVRSQRADRGYPHPHCLIIGEAGTP